jgi:hypothetical protein
MNLCGFEQEEVVGKNLETLNCALIQIEKLLQMMQNLLLMGHSKNEVMICYSKAMQAYCCELKVLPVISQSMYTEELELLYFLILFNPMPLKFGINIYSYHSSSSLSKLTSDGDSTESDTSNNHSGDEEPRYGMRLSTEESSENQSKSSSPYSYLGR